MAQMASQQAFVVLSDLVRSQRMTNRALATEKVKIALRVLNTRFKRSIIAPMEITRGDEAAAVLKSLDALPEMLFGFFDNLLPFRSRVVIVYGTLTTGLASRRSTEIDGPAFYAADETMRQLKKTLQRFRLSTGQQMYDEAITSLVNLLIIQRERMTKFQRRVYSLYDEGKSQRALARLLKRTQQQVSQALRAAHYDVQKDSELSIRLLIREMEQRMRNGVVDD